MRVHGSLGERASARNAALSAHRAPRDRDTLAQRAQRRHRPTKAARERALLGLQREQRRQRRHRAPAQVVQRVERVGRRGRAWLPVPTRGAQVPVGGARGLQVESLEPRMQDALRAVHVAVHDAGLRRVVTKVAALVVPLGELATVASESAAAAVNGMRHPQERLVVFVVLLLGLVVALRGVLLRQLAAKALRLLNLRAPASTLGQQRVGLTPVVCALPVVRAARRRAARAPTLAEHAHGARHARERLAHLEAHALDLAPQRLGREPVRLREVVQRRPAEALGRRRTRQVARVAQRRVAARRVGVQLGRDRVDAHLQADAAHLVDDGVLGLVQSPDGRGRTLARDVACVHLAKARSALLVAVGRHARATALAHALPHVFLELATPSRAALGVRAGRRLGGALGRQLLLGAHAREQPAHQRKVRTARVRRVGELAVDAHVATILGTVAAAVHCQPELRGDGVRLQGGRAVLGHLDHVARVICLQSHRVLGGREGRRRVFGVVVFLFRQSPSIGTVARG